MRSWHHSVTCRGEHDYRTCYTPQASALCGSVATAPRRHAPVRTVQQRTRPSDCLRVDVRDMSSRHAAVGISTRWKEAVWLQGEVGGGAGALGA